MTSLTSNGRFWLAASPLALCAALIATPAAAQDATASNPAVPSPISPAPTADQSKDEAEAAGQRMVASGKGPVAVYAVEIEEEA